MQNFKNKGRMPVVVFTLVVFLILAGIYLISKQLSASETKNFHLNTLSASSPIPSFLPTAISLKEAEMVVEAYLQCIENDYPNCQYPNKKSAAKTSSPLATSSPSKTLLLTLEERQFFSKALNKYLDCMEEYINHPPKAAEGKLLFNAHPILGIQDMPGGYQIKKSYLKDNKAVVEVVLVFGTDPDLPKTERIIYLKEEDGKWLIDDSSSLPKQSVDPDSLPDFHCQKD